MKNLSATVMCIKMCFFIVKNEGQIYHHEQEERNDAQAKAASVPFSRSFNHKMFYVDKTLQLQR